MHRQANLLRTSLSMAKSRLDWALAKAKEGERGVAMAEWIGQAEDELAVALRAESDYSLALERRFSRVVGRSTGFSHALRTYHLMVGEARRQLVYTEQWSPEMEATLTRVAHDLSIVLESLPEALLDRGDFDGLQARFREARERFQVSEPGNR